MSLEKGLLPVGGGNGSPTECVGDDRTFLCSFEEVVGVADAAVTEAFDDGSSM